MVDSRYRRGLLSGHRAERNRHRRIPERRRMERGAGQHDRCADHADGAVPVSGGSMPQTSEAVLNTNGITDNAENSNDVYVGALPGGIVTSGNNVTLTLPPYSVVAIH